MAKKKPPKEDIATDWSLINQLQNHIHVFGFASVLDNLTECCEDKLKTWQQRLGKAKKLRKALGDDFGRN